jgi:hypothetical protein
MNEKTYHHRKTSACAYATNRDSYGDLVVTVTSIINVVDEKVKVMK